MNERRVLYTEQAQREVRTPGQEVPAPMVERAFRLLDLLSATEEGLTLSDLARALNMSKGSLHGLLRTLEGNGAIEQAEERRFVLGPRVYQLALAYTQHAGLRRFALPAMRALASGSGETVCLGRVEPHGVRIIECVIAEREQSGLHIAVRRGMRIPLLAGAIGACVLASWPRERQEEYLSAHPLPRFTAHSLTERSRFLARMEEVAHSGLSIDHEEYLDGVNAVAAPIYGVDDELVALLWIVGFASRLQGEILADAARLLRAESMAISQALGARG